MPEDTQGVLRLFALAGRAVCADPSGSGPVSATLERLVARLVPPERQTGEDAARLWSVFARVAALGKPKLLREAGRALYRDLEQIGRSLELPPLPRWRELPEWVVDPEPLDDATIFESRMTLDEARTRTRTAALKKAPVTAEVLGMLRDLADQERADLYRELLEAGELGRADLTGVEQLVERGLEPEGDDDLTAVNLAVIGRWLAR